MASYRRLGALRRHFPLSTTTVPARSVQELLDLSGQVAIVTGGGTHLGLAMATTLCELGATVILASRRGELCELEAGRLREAQGFSIHGTGCDVTDELAVDKLVAGVVAAHGRLDIMICNAGGSASTTYPPHASIDEFVATFDMNVKSTFICAQSAARSMIAAGRRGVRILPA